MPLEPDIVLLSLGAMVVLWHGAAIAELLDSRRTTGSKLKWALAIVLLAPFGLIAWWIRGRERRGRRFLGVTGYLTIAFVSAALLLALTRTLWQDGLEYPAWLIAWSVVTFAMYLVDKLAARQGQDDDGNSKAARVNERALHLFALLGGFAGGWIGRHGLRHKTRKLEFGVILALATAAHLSKLAGLW